MAVFPLFLSFFYFYSSSRFCQLSIAILIGTMGTIGTTLIAKAFFVPIKLKAMGTGGNKS